VTVLALKCEEIVLATFSRTIAERDREGVVVKANKALKRLTKIEVLISDVAERYSSGGFHVREALKM
jgi:hypothetical protein